MTEHEQATPIPTGVFSCAAVSCPRPANPDPEYLITVTHQATRLTTTSYLHFCSYHTGSQLSLLKMIDPPALNHVD